MERPFSKTCTLLIPVVHITSMTGFHIVRIFSKRHFRAGMLAYLLEKSISVSTEYFCKYARGVIGTAKTYIIQLIVALFNNFQT